MGCNLCPRNCNADRAHGQKGYCGATDKIKIARAAPHMWEEPCISGRNGSGAIFFSGCPLRCVFCQNSVLSGDCYGKEISGERLAQIILSLAKSGVHNINLVTPTHFSDKIAAVLEKMRPLIKIPIVYNCGGYEKIETLRMLDGLIDIYLPDFKYMSEELAEKYSHARDYPKVASAALAEMTRQCGKAVFDSDGMMQKGVIVRHLVLPGCRHDSMKVLDTIARTVNVSDIKISIMRQYTPGFADSEKYPELNRRITTFEYNSVVNHAQELGFEGYTQKADSADCIYTPSFDLTGI